MKMFGYNNSIIDNKPYKIFRWKVFRDNEMILRILPNYFSEKKLYDRIYSHQINGKFYLHPIDKECMFCNILNNNEKYVEIQDKILKLKLIENKKEKWNHVITNHMSINIFAIIKGYDKIQLIRFYDNLATELLNIIIAKDIKDDITDLYKGNSIKIIFNKLTYFPYLSISDIIIGQSKAIFSNETKITELDNQLHNKIFNSYIKKEISEDDVIKIIDQWYEKALTFYNTYSKNDINENTLDMFDHNIQSADEFDFDNNTNDNENLDEIPF